MSETIHPKNIVGRGMVFNDKETWNNSIAASGIHGKDHREMPSFAFEAVRKQLWSKLKNIGVESVKQTVSIASPYADQLGSGEVPGIAAAFMGTFAGPLQRIAANQVKKRCAYAVMVAKGILCEPEFPVEITGTWEEVRDLVMERGRKFLVASGKKAIDLDDAVLDRASSVTACKIKSIVEQGGTCAQTIYISGSEFEKMVEAAADPKKGLAAARGISITAEKMKSITRGRIQDGYHKIKMGATKLFLNGMGSLLQIYSLGSATAELSEKGAKKESIMNFMAAFSSTVASFADSLDGSLSALLPKGLSYGKKFSQVQKISKWLGKAGTVAAGVLTAWMDLDKAKQEDERGHKIRMYIYYLSATIGALGTTATILGWIAATNIVGSWLLNRCSLWTAEVVAGFFVTVGFWVTILALAITALLQLSEPSATEACLEFNCWGRNRKDSEYKSVYDEKMALMGAIG